MTLISRDANLHSIKDFGPDDIAIRVYLAMVYVTRERIDAIGDIQGD